MSAKTCHWCGGMGYELGSFDPSTLCTRCGGCGTTPNQPSTDQPPMPTPDQAAAKPENPPAFPEFPIPPDAMFPDQCTLRDWFAGQALAGLISNLSYGAELQRIFDPKGEIANGGDPKEAPITYASRLTYAFADALLAERSKEAKP